jgi:hypothetical protein
MRQFESEKICWQVALVYRQKVRADALTDGLDTVVHLVAATRVHRVTEDAKSQPY